MKNQFLTKEIVNHILMSFGITLSLKSEGNVLSANELLTNKIIKIKYDDDLEIDHKVYAGHMIVSSSSKFKAVFANLTSEIDEPEYACVFRLDDLPLHGLRVRYDSNGTDREASFKVYDEKNKSWIDAPIIVQAMVLSGTEKIISYGLLWEKNDQFEEMYRAILKLV